jgi:alpha-ribazole phosphatase
LGRLDLPVSADGESLWPSVKSQLLQLGAQRVFTSPLRRAHQHASELGLPLTVLEGLAEQSFGAWEGQPWEAIATDDAVSTNAFFANPVLATPPGGESFARCASRAIQALQGALEGESSTLVIAHGGSLRAVLAHFLGLPLDRALDLAWQPFGLTKLEVYGPNKALLRFHNRPLPS